MGDDVTQLSGRVDSHDPSGWLACHSDDFVGVFNSRAGHCLIDHASSSGACREVTCSEENMFIDNKQKRIGRNEGEMAFAVRGSIDRSIHPSQMPINIRSKMDRMIGW
jgi:hypothetical protein